MKLERLAKDPLVHFLLIGAGLFALYAAIGGEDSSSPGNRIEVTEADVQRLRAGWIREHETPPTPVQLDALIEEEVRQEVFYREALALGLDRGDTVIRSRLAEKMEFFAEEEDPVQSSTQAQKAERRKALFDELSQKYDIVRPDLAAPGDEP